MKVSIAALALAAGLVACGDSRSTDSATTDLQRDLDLASATTMSLATPRVDSALFNSMETKPEGTPEAAKTVRKAAGPRAVRSQTPTVRATPEVDVAALDESDEVQAESEAPVPEPTNEPVAVAPRPTPVIIQTGGAGDYGTGSGGGVFGGGTGRGGIVIRGGGIDGDNCIPRRGGGVITRGPIYMPSPTVVRTGGIYDIGGRTRGTSSPIARAQPSGTSSRGISMRGRGMR